MAVLAALVTVLAQPRNELPSKVLMRQKLDHAQSALEAITLENFELLAVHAGKMRALGEQPSWNLFDTAEYAEQSLLFKRNVDQLSKAARERNLDGATLAYTKVTFSCVECHKYIRDRKVKLIEE
jgi:cytochrome c556